MDPFTLENFGNDATLPVPRHVSGAAELGVPGVLYIAPPIFLEIGKILTLSTSNISRA